MVQGELVDSMIARTEAVTGPVIEALPGIARIAAYSWLHTAEWSVVASVKAGRRVARAVVDPDSAADLAKEVGQTVSVVAGLAQAVTNGVPLPTAVVQLSASLGKIQEEHLHHGPPVRGASLRERGAELLDRSRDVWNTEQAHPAYERILTELAPDEGRILLLLLKGGPQPSVDVRTGGPVGMVSSQLVAPGLTMIGARAGCRYLDQVPSYLNNLFRLGLVWFSREALKDPLEYQVVEAQPDVLEAMHSVRFAKVVRRSVHLTPFGDDFCRSVLVDEVPDATDLPEHQSPEE